MNAKKRYIVIVINFGKVACSNYYCLVHYLVKPLGEMLGQLFLNHFRTELSRMDMIGLSLGGKRKKKKQHKSLKFKEHKMIKQQ